YVAYTATPFANILIPHNTDDPQKKNDLYPKDFIVDLPKPDGYFGAEELFGLVNPISEEEAEGLDIIREVAEADVGMLEAGRVPKSLEDSILSFVLSGAAFAQRGRGKEPATMLIHTDFHIQNHTTMKSLVEQKFSEFKDKWRYQKDLGIKKRLNELWDSEFRPVTQAIHPELDVDFDKIEPFINPFFEAIQIRTVNSSTGEILDYEREPRLKAIAIGGNKFSRGLTLEGLMSSFFTRSSSTYDTLMQMGRWFGFRRGYDDLTRIWTTAELAEWFADLAFVERNLRDDIQVYEAMNITPKQVGMRIWLHPTMQVTSPLKSRYAQVTRISQSYNGQAAQTYKFPFDQSETISNQADANYSTTISFLAEIGKPEWGDKGPIWRNVPEKKVIEFLKKFQHDDSYTRSGFSLPLICSYIENQFAVNELTQWTIAVRGQENEEGELGEAKWSIRGGKIWQISRSRLRLTKSSLGVITSPGDEKAGLNGEAEMKKFGEIRQQRPELAESRAARMARPPQEGLILIYPISKNSKPAPKKDGSESRTRQPLYEDANNQYAKDLIGLAVSFPESQQDHPVQAYLEGTNRWRPVE
ncbi:MAG TPA: Z1 domain-containing protein, partial [Candidatus Aquilonibacter sp.]|nr:Z1 domain-containing protein [Candidatus Aquilonibacter sp.]